MYGSTSGYVELEAPAVADDGVLTLPTVADGFGAAGIGSNVVSTLKNDTFSATSTAFVDVTGLTVTITPSTATSKVLLICNVALGQSASNGPFIALTNSSNTFVFPVASGSQFDALLNNTIGGVNDIVRQTIVGVVSPASASAQTYKVRLRSGSGATTSYVNRSGSGGGFATSTLTAIEVAA